MAIDRFFQPRRFNSPNDIDFETTYYIWLDRILSRKIPREIVGFSFNLVNLVEFEEEPKFGIELAGTPTFSKEDEDWASDDIFYSKRPRTLEIPKSYSGENWEQCLEKMTKLTASYLKSETNGARILNSAIGIGIGFVDGNLTLLKS